MVENKLKVCGSCYFVETVYGPGIKDVALEYTEHATDHWSSDTETSIEINKEKAVEIVNFLNKAFSI